MKKQKLQFKGNRDLLEHFKTAFFCSREAPDIVISKSYKWAAGQKNQESCIISGFHSQIERELLHFLVKENQPVIMVLARSLYKRIPDPELKHGLDNGNLLLVSPFGNDTTRVSSKTARKRNELMIDMADEIMVAHASFEGAITRLIPKMQGSRKLLYSFDIPQNQHLLNLGFYSV